jgi:hypothetical protein
MMMPHVGTNYAPGGSKSLLLCRGRSYSQPRCAGLGGPFRSPMNNYWMTNNAMETGYAGLQVF